MEKLTLTRWELLFKKSADDMWTWLVYSGLWIEPLRYEIQNFIDELNKKVNGTVRIKLYKGNVMVVGRSSPNALYDIELSTYEDWSTYNQSLAKGFIELWGLQSIIAYNRCKNGT